MIEMYQNLEEPLVTSGDSPDSFFIRTSYEQFIYQEGERNLIPRTIALFEFLPGAVPARSANFDIPGAVHQVLGMSLRDFLLHAFFISAATRKRGAVHIDYLADKAVKKLGPVLETEKMMKVLSILSCTFEEFREAARQSPTRKGYEKFSYNPLLAKPVIRSACAPHTFLVPSPTLLVRRMTASVFYDVLDAQSERDKAAFMTRFGDIVEAYVDRLLDPYVKDLLRERDFAANGGPDFAVRAGTRGALVECKSARLTVSTKSFADEQSLQTDLAKGFLGGCKQLGKKREHVMNNAKGFEPLHGVVDPYLVLVTMEPFYMCNAPPMRNVVNGLMAERGDPSVPYQALHIAELEQMAPSLTTKVLLDSLNEKTSDPVMTAWPFERYFAERFPGFAKKWHPWLRDLWHDFVSPFDDSMTSER